MLASVTVAGSIALLKVMVICREKIAVEATSGAVMSASVNEIGATAPGPCRPWR